MKKIIICQALCILCIAACTKKELVEPPQEPPQVIFVQRVQDSAKMMLNFCKCTSLSELSENSYALEGEISCLDKKMSFADTTYFLFKVSSVDTVLWASDKPVRFELDQLLSSASRQTEREDSLTDFRMLGIDKMQKSAFTFNSSMLKIEVLAEWLDFMALCRTADGCYDIFLELPEFKVTDIKYLGYKLEALADKNAKANFLFEVSYSLPLGQVKKQNLKKEVLVKVN